MIKTKESIIDDMADEMDMAIVSEAVTFSDRQEMAKILYNLGYRKMRNIGDMAVGIIDTLCYDNSIQDVEILGYAYIVRDEYGDITMQNVERIYDTKEEAKKVIKH